MATVRNLMVLKSSALLTWKVQETNTIINLTVNMKIILQRVSLFSQFFYDTARGSQIVDSINTKYMYLL